MKKETALKIKKTVMSSNCWENHI